MRVSLCLVHVWCSLSLLVGEGRAVSAFVSLHSFAPTQRVSHWASVSSHDTDENGEQEQQQQLSRREALACATAAVTAASVLRIPFPPAVIASAGAPVEISASWSAVDGLNKASSSDFVSFDKSAYQAMRDDPSRTPLFQKALIDRLNSAPGGPSTVTVLDMGTGPFALFGILAAEAGAGKVYAIEADPEAARNARSTIKRAGYSDVITVLEGFSTDVSLPDNAKVDVVVAEIVGSVASEEGVFATILDAHARFVKEPNDPASWIPNRIQTYAAPASYTLHNMFKPPEFDWTKLAGEPVRFNCRDTGLQLLSDPVLVEDISFADISAATQKAERIKDLAFTLSAERMEENEDSLYENLRSARVKVGEAAALATETAHSLSGIAFWPRLVLDAKATVVVNSRTYPNGGHQRSHWQTVLPICCARPVGDLKGGEKVEVTADFEVSDKVTTPSQYRLNGKVFIS